MFKINILKSSGYLLSKALRTCKVVIVFVQEQLSTEDLERDHSLCLDKQGSKLWVLAFRILTWSSDSDDNGYVFYHATLLCQDTAAATAAATAAKSFQSCPTLCHLIDGSPPGSPVPGILQARTLEWVAIPFSNAWKWKVKVKLLSRVRPSATPWTAASVHGICQARVLEWGAIAFSVPGHKSTYYT